MARGVSLSGVDNADIGSFMSSRRRSVSSPAVSLFRILFLFYERNCERFLMSLFVLSLGLRFDGAVELQPIPVLMFVYCLSQQGCLFLSGAGSLFTTVISASATTPVF